MPIIRRPISYRMDYYLRRTVGSLMIAGLGFYEAFFIKDGISMWQRLFLVISSLVMLGVFYKYSRYWKIESDYWEKYKSHYRGDFREVSDLYVRYGIEFFGWISMIYILIGWRL